MRLPRFVHWIYAHQTGHFWLPCPICKKNFGGHEASETSLMETPSSGKLVCKNCTELARQMNEKLFRDATNIPYITKRIEK